MDVEWGTLKHDLTEDARSSIGDVYTSLTRLFGFYFVVDRFHHLAEREAPLIAIVLVDALQPGIVISPCGTIKTEVAGTHKRDGAIVRVKLCLTERNLASDMQLSDVVLCVNSSGNEFQHSLEGWRNAITARVAGVGG